MNYEKSTIKKIKNICKNLEKKNKIKILFAVENGSRAWRFHSKDSDYDLRFVFVRPLKDYIQINKPEEVINVAFDKGGRQTEPEGAFIDVSGFDIFKYAKLLAASNPTSIEWLITDIVYYGKQNLAFKNFAVKNFEAISLYQHYKSLCRNNYTKYIKSGSDVTGKRYLYSFRGLINAKWVANKKTVPPINFLEVLKKSGKIIPDYIRSGVDELIEMKMQGKEEDKIQNITKFDEYIENFLKSDNEMPTVKRKVNLDKINTEIRRILL